jgi:hypothetical protein
VVQTIWRIYIHFPVLFFFFFLLLVLIPTT